ncbi:MAG: DUF4249 family protein [Syntrophothermus sp.]
MKTDKIKKYFVFALLVIISGCQKTDLIDPGIAYREKIVVVANLQEGLPFSGVSFTRTLPLNSSFDKSNAVLSDVTVWLRINGIKIIPLHYDKGGIYKPMDIFTVHAGEEFELFARYSGKDIYSKTRIPSRPSVNSSMLAEGKYLESRLVPEANTVYGAVWLIAGNNSYSYADTASDFFEIIKPSGLDVKSDIAVRTIEIPEKYLSEEYTGKVYVRVFAFDNDYYEYFRSRTKNQQVNNSFTQGGGDIAWNIKGKDAIGLFIGSAQGVVIKPK